MQICVGSSLGVFCVGNLAKVFVWVVFWSEIGRCKLCSRVFAWCVLCGELGRCKFVQGLRLGCFLGRDWQVQICVGSSLDAFCVGNLAGVSLCRVFVWFFFWGETGR